MSEVKAQAAGCGFRFTADDHGSRAIDRQSVDTLGDAAEEADDGSSILYDPHHARDRAGSELPVRPAGLGASFNVGDPGDWNIWKGNRRQLELVIQAPDKTFEQRATRKDLGSGEGPRLWPGLVIAMLAGACIFAAGMAFTRFLLP